MLTRTCVIAAAFLTLATVAGGATLTQDEAARTRSAPGVLTALETLARLEHDTAAYSEALSTLSDDPHLSVTDREAALHAGTLRLAALPASDDARTLLARLAMRPVNMRVQVEDGHGAHTTPLFDVAAAARYVARHWSVLDASRDISTDIAKGVPATTLARKSDRHDVLAVGLQHAMENASIDQLLAQRAVLLDALPVNPETGPAALVAGRRLADGDLLRAVVTHADERTAQGAVEAAANVGDSYVALEVIDAGLARAATASMSVFALASLYDANPTAADTLVKLLEDPTLGGSAAAALARRDDADLADKLGERLLTEPRAHVAARLALALALMQNDTARQRLQEFAHTAGMHADLRAAMAERVR